MYKKSVLVIGIVWVGILLTGCMEPYTYTPPPPKVYINQYDPILTKTLNEKVGNGSIQGTAFLRQGGGGVVTCAGNEVILVPKTPYSTEYLEDEFISHRNGSFDSKGKGYKKTGFLGYYYIITPDGEKKSTNCDAQGNFIFDKVGDGEYYVITNVNWEVGRDTQGGNLSQYVKLLNNESKKIILSK